MEVGYGSLPARARFPPFPADVPRHEPAPANARPCQDRRAPRGGIMERNGKSQAGAEKLEGASSRPIAARPARTSFVTLRSGDTYGLDGHPIDVQVDVVPDTQKHTFQIVGLPGRSTRESRERVSTAIVNSGFRGPRGRILVNLAPACREKDGGGLDLPVAIGIFIATGQIGGPAARSAVEAKLRKNGLLGELGLSGELRPVRGAIL